MLLFPFFFSCCFFFSMSHPCCSGKSKFIWREPVVNLIGSLRRQDLIEAMQDTLDNQYREQAPWTIFTEEVTRDGLKDRIYAQVTKKVGQMQPVHWDTAVPWFYNNKGPWAPLSIVLHVNDGLTTCLPAAPDPILQRIPDNLELGDHPETLADAAQSVLTMLDKTAKSMPTKMSRSTQCLAFHAGEQPHAGMSWDGAPDRLFPKWQGRVVVYFFAVPREHFELVKDFELFNSEYPYGLIKAIDASQVFKKFVFGGFFGFLP